MHAFLPQACGDAVREDSELRARSFKAEQSMSLKQYKTLLAERGNNVFVFQP